MTADISIRAEPAAGIGSLATEAPGLLPPGGDRPPRLGRRSRLTLIALGLLALLIALVTLTTGQSAGGTLDPRSAGPDGTRALAVLLRGQGIAVDRGAATGAGRTVLVPFPEALKSADLESLVTSGADVVLVDPGPVDVAQVTAGDVISVRTRPPGCPLPAAMVAGAARLGGTQYTSGNAAVTCYDGALLALPAGSAQGAGRITILGSADFLTNAHLDQQGNAALALGLLSGQPRLTWYTARRASSGATLTSLLPKAVPWAVLQLGIALVVIGFWRGRRLGPVVTEPLPVVVRAGETVLGRARLYAAARARDTAVNALRTGSRARLAGLVHLDPHVSPEALVLAVASRTGWEPATISAVLYEGSALSGPDGSPGYGAADSDAALVRLADDLDRLENQAREMTSR
ncbi:MAG TPA: DUF4350 domain-containing protein [Frankiaceae bacterium]|jgi:hypothetical protein|nr:DUF4350 domain-containing protein [Frankiaceae bacterium]